MIYQTKKSLNIDVTPKCEGQAIQEISILSDSNDSLNKTTNESDSSFFCPEGVKESKKSHSLTSFDMIKSLIRAKGMQQAEFARSIGMSRQSLNNYIRGEWRPPARIKLKIAEGLGVDSSTIWDFLEDLE